MRKPTLACVSVKLPLSAYGATGALTGFASAHFHSCACMQRWPLGSSTAAKGDETYQAPLSSTVYIEQTDFREDGQAKDFYGLTPGREVLLRCVS